MSTKELFTGMVLYTDGGCRPNPGHAGIGVHGYTYTMSKNPKGIGHTTHVATTLGYENKFNLKKDNQNLAGVSADKLALSQDEIDALISKSEIVRKEFVFTEFEALSQEAKGDYILGNLDEGFRVEVMSFFDLLGCESGMENTNNSAEIFAAIEGFRAAINAGVKVLVLRVDSELIINAINGWIEGWIRNNWVTKTLKPVSNRKLWEDLHSVRNLYLETGGRYVCRWVKGHREDIGNISADSLATAGVFMSRRDNTTARKINISKASGYWATDVNACHPMLNHRYCYFMADIAFANTREYYVGNQGKEVDLIAKKTADSGYAVVRVDEGVEFIDMIVNNQIKLDHELQSMCLLDLENLYGAPYRYLNIYREDFLYQPLKHRRDIRSADDHLIARELHPAIIATRAIDSMIKFSMILSEFLNGTNGNITKTDVTSLMYERGQKGETKLLSEIGVGHTHFNTKVNVLGLAEPFPLTLTCGIDVPDRNTLKRIEDLNPVVSVITWGRDPYNFQYATVIQATGCSGIWAGPQTNMRVLEHPRGLS